MSKYLLKYQTLSLVFLSVFFACKTTKHTGEALETDKKAVTLYTVTHQDIKFLNPLDSIHLSGTLSTPDGLDNFPAVILISGSGPQNRDSEIFGHKPFLTIANYLSEHGIAVLRYDDRGVAKSEGKFATATSNEFAKDVLSAAGYLKNKQNVGKIGLVGHSEGGMIAQITAANSKTLIDFIVSLAGPGIHIKELMRIQNRIAVKGMGFSDTETEEYIKFISDSYEILDVSTPKEELYDPLKEIVHTYYESVPDSTQAKLAPSKESLYFQLAYSYFTPWFRYFINYNPAKNLQRLECPVLALNGQLDVQVTATENLNGYKKHLAAGTCPDFKVMQLDSLNHLFQKAITGNTDEYKTITEDFNHLPLKIIRDWIQSLN